MERLTFQEFLAVRDEFDAAVRATPGISQFCSSSGWIIPAFLGLNELDPESTTTLIVREGDSWLVFFERRPNFFYPFEAAWMFQCPLIGPNAVALLKKARTEFFNDPKGFVIGGIPKESEIASQLAELETLQMDTFPATECMTIDLSEGVNSWLLRRSKKFRRSLRDAGKNCEAANVIIENVAPDFDRLLAIQQQTVKWQDGSDILHHDDCLQFYQKMLLVEKSPHLEMCFRVATIDGQDAAFLLGAVFRNTFRGLQMSYKNEFRSLGLGNFLQMETLRYMADEKQVGLYDLGMFSDYKSRWADESREFEGRFVIL